jgi:hypothetical protein
VLESVGAVVRKEDPLSTRTSQDKESTQVIRKDMKFGPSLSFVDLISVTAGTRTGASVVNETDPAVEVPIAFTALTEYVYEVEAVSPVKL